MKFSKFTRDILLTISLDLLEVLIDFVETGNLMYKKPEYWSSIKRFKGFDKAKIIKKLDSLSRQGFIEKIEDKYYVTKRGCKKFNDLSCHFDIKLPKEIPWQGQWNLIMFDIPQNQSKDRRKLRNILKSAGLLKVQQSIYIYPHDISDEFKKIQIIFPKRQLLLVKSDSNILTILFFDRFKESNVLI